VSRFRASPLKVEQKIRATADRDLVWASERDYPKPSIRMEEEPGSSGAALISHYRRNVLDSHSFKGVRSSGSKLTRAEPVAARAEAGDIKMCLGTWNDAFLDEVVAFPRSAHDGQVDALSGAYGAIPRRSSSEGLPDLIAVNESLWRPNPWDD
jgi:predicted phage terminase large subunit-like protein